MVFIIPNQITNLPFLIHHLDYILLPDCVSLISLHVHDPVNPVPYLDEIIVRIYFIVLTLMYMGAIYILSNYQHRVKKSIHILIVEDA